MNNDIARRDLFGLAAATLATAATSASVQAADAPPKPNTGIEHTPGAPIPTAVIPTTSGRVLGLVREGVQTFKGIRYGAPPVGQLRWMPPQRPKPATVILDCSDYGAPAIQLVGGPTAAPQSDFGMQMSRVFTTPSELKVQSEDCLFLNVWTPATDAKKRPVMVWIHGGGFQWGSSNQPIYDMEALAREHDVTCVSMNHRLNIFGYMHLGDAMGSTYASSGTVGMQDLVMALQWVRDNIASFGGDPGNVTIMGQSGGGFKVATLMAMDSAKGLFHKASIQSGAGLEVGRKAQAAKNTQLVLDELGVKPGDIQALRALPYQTLIAAVDAVAARQPGGGMPGMGPRGLDFSPILDGIAITRDPFSPDAPAASADVPLLIGYVKDEMSIFMASNPWFYTMTEEQLKQFAGFTGPKGPKLVEAWRKIRPDYSPSYLFVAAISSQFFGGNSITLAERKAAQGKAPVFMWNMTWETPVSNGVFKTPHTMEIPFMLESWRRLPQFVGPAKPAANMAKQIAGAWVAFARTGIPDGPATPHWPAYDTTTRSVMVFDTTSKVVNDPNPEVRQILQEK